MSEHLDLAEQALFNARRFPTATTGDLGRSLGHVIEHLRALDSASATPEQRVSNEAPAPSPRPAPSRAPYVLIHVDELTLDQIRDAVDFARERGWRES